MTTQLALYKEAALILREPASTLTVSTDSVLVNALNDVWAEARSFTLESGRWNFAARSVALESDTDAEPEFGYSFSFQKPSDYKNLIALSGSATFYPAFGANEYRDEGERWYANVDPLYASIVSDDAAFGGDLSLWPDVVAKALQYELAFRVAPHVTNWGQDALDRLEKQKERALRKARSWDAAKQPPEQPSPGRLASARRGRSAWRETWRA
jgi:hypothetical protein